MFKLIKKNKTKTNNNNKKQQQQNNNKRNIKQNKLCYLWNNST